MSKEVGNLNVWFAERGFGFIHRVQDGVIVKYFLHISNIMSGEPIVGSVVHFDSALSPKGFCALNAEILPPERISHADAAAILMDAAAPSNGVTR